MELYFNICSLLRIELQSGYLFRSVKKGELHVTSDRCTLHGFRRGAGILLALAGVSLHEIMDHVGRENSRTALHYIKLKQVVNPARAAAQPDLDCGIGTTYMRLNNLEGLSPVF